ncbi:GNAT family N-acetyltransferase [Spiribacter roseus]|uniref:GNAT family N-acetyltransferase n=1 Tax=Spiribacter roseus TaxID=1855875 RepID=UPI00190F9013|nr:GNAT family N-acetyltransferase [Spiribacter roseus]
MAERLGERTGYRFHLVTDPESLTETFLQQIQPRYVFFPHWSSVIPPAIHENYECVIFHMTDLPYGRGGSPLQNLIQRGHTTTQISALRCVAALDAGPIYLKRPLSLEGAASEIFLRAAGVIEEMIETILRDQPAPAPQQGEPVTFQRRKPEESDLAKAPVATLNDFFDFIRMLDAEGYPHAFLDMKGHRIELSRVQKETDRLVGTFVISRQDHLPVDEEAGVKALLDRCYPAPPRDVFDRLQQLYRPGDPVYTVEINRDLAGIVHCARHSKGGHLETLAVDPAYRGVGLADDLVNTLLADTGGVVSLTTRIPAFFERHQFTPAATLNDGSVYMIRPASDVASSENSH